MVVLKAVWLVEKRVALMAWNLVGSKEGLRVEKKDDKKVVNLVEWKDALMVVWKVDLKAVNLVWSLAVMMGARAYCLVVKKVVRSVARLVEYLVVLKELLWAGKMDDLQVESLVGQWAHCSVAQKADLKVDCLVWKSVANWVAQMVERWVFLMAENLDDHLAARLVEQKVALWVS